MGLYNSGIVLERDIHNLFMSIKQTPEWPTRVWTMLTSTSHMKGWRCHPKEPLFHRVQQSTYFIFTGVRWWAATLSRR